MTNRLNVTTTAPVGVDLWDAYEVITTPDGPRAYVVYSADLESCRRYADRHGYEGILIGSPSVPRTSHR